MTKTFWKLKEQDFSKRTNIRCFGTYKKTHTENLWSSHEIGQNVSTTCIILPTPLHTQYIGTVDLELQIVCWLQGFGIATTEASFHVEDFYLCPYTNKETFYRMSSFTGQCFNKSGSKSGLGEYQYYGT